MTDITLFSECFFPNPFPAHLTPNLLSTLCMQLVTPDPTRGGGSTDYWGLEGGLGSSYVAYIFVFLGNTIICRLFKLSLPDQVQVILQLRVSPF